MKQPYTTTAHGRAILERERLSLERAACFPKPEVTEELRPDGSLWEVAIYPSGLRTAMRVSPDRDVPRRR